MALRPLPQSKLPSRSDAVPGARPLTEESPAVDVVDPLRPARLDNRVAGRGERGLLGAAALTGGRVDEDQARPANPGHHPGAGRGRTHHDRGP